MIQPTKMFEKGTRAYSQVYGSRELAKYFIGRPDGAIALLFPVSEKEAHEIVTNLPDELLELVKEHYGLVPAAVKADSIEEAAQEEEAEPLLVDVDGIDIDELDVTQLKDLAKQLDIKGYSKMTKDKLILAIGALAEASEEE